MLKWKPGAVPPTEAQAKAGNYPKGHLSFQGLPITIENAAGTTRSGTDASGKAWSTTMRHDYGYVKRTEGADGDHVDVFIGPDADAQDVHIVNQHDPDTGDFDEHKCMLGFRTREAAQRAYMANFESGWQGFGGMVTVPVADFKAWLRDGNTTSRAVLKAIREQEITMREFLKAQTHTEAHYRVINGRVVYVEGYDSERRHADHGEDSHISQRSVRGVNRAGNEYIRATTGRDRAIIARIAAEMNIPVRVARAGATHHGRAGAYDHVYFDNADDANRVHQRLDAIVHATPQAPATQTPGPTPAPEPAQAPARTAIQNATEAGRHVAQRTAIKRRIAELTAPTGPLLDTAAAMDARPTRVTRIHSLNRAIPSVVSGLQVLTHYLEGHANDDPMGFRRAEADLADGIATLLEAYSTRKIEAPDDTATIAAEFDSCVFAGKRIIRERALVDGWTEDDANERSQEFADSCRSVLQSYLSSRYAPTDTRYQGAGLARVTAHYLTAEQEFNDAGATFDGVEQAHRFEQFKGAIGRPHMAIELAVIKDDANSETQGVEDGDVRTINGHTYVLRDGRWHRQDAGTTREADQQTVVDALERWSAMTGEQHEAAVAAAGRILADETRPGDEAMHDLRIVVADYLTPGSGIEQAMRVVETVSDFMSEGSHPADRATNAAMQLVYFQAQEDVEVEGTQQAQARATSTGVSGTVDPTHSAPAPAPIQRDPSANNPISQANQHWRNQWALADQQTRSMAVAASVVTLLRQQDSADLEPIIAAAWAPVSPTPEQARTAAAGFDRLARYLDDYDPGQDQEVKTAQQILAFWANEQGDQMRSVAGAPAPAPAPAPARNNITWRTGGSPAGLLNERFVLHNTNGTSNKRYVIDVRHVGSFPDGSPAFVANAGWGPIRSGRGIANIRTLTPNPVTREIAMATAEGVINAKRQGGYVFNDTDPRHDTMDNFVHPSRSQEPAPDVAPAVVAPAPPAAPAPAATVTPAAARTAYGTHYRQAYDLGNAARNTDGGTYDRAVQARTAAIRAHEQALAYARQHGIHTERIAGGDTPEAFHTDRLRMHTSALESLHRSRYQAAMDTASGQDHTAAIQAMQTLRALQDDQSIPESARTRMRTILGSEPHHQLGVKLEAANRRASTSAASGLEALQAHAAEMTPTERDALASATEAVRRFGAPAAPSLHTPHAASGEVVAQATQAKAAIEAAARAIDAAPKRAYTHHLIQGLKAAAARIITATAAHETHAARPTTANLQHSANYERAKSAVAGATSAHNASPRDLAKAKAAIHAHKEHAVAAYHRAMAMPDGSPERTQLMTEAQDSATKAQAIANRFNQGA